MKLSDYIARFVADLGVRHLFLLPGGGCMHLVESFSRQESIRYVCNLHEQACAIAADAYGQYTNQLGVALVTTGPGGTNALTGVAAAWLDSTPCLFISGQVKRADLKGARGVRQMGFQEIDIVRMAEPVTKYAVTITDPATTRFHLEKAVWLARRGRPGPVWLDVPLDVQSADVDPAALPGFTPEPEPAAPLAGWVERALAGCNAAERPVVLAGNGVRLAGALEEFRAFIGLLGAPVLTTWKALDFLAEDHPLYCGRPGATGQRGANFTQQNADWIITLGARLDFGQTGYNHPNFARAARRVIVDIDPAEIAKMEMPVDVPAAADAGEFLRAFLARAGELQPRDRAPWLDRAKGWQRRYPVCLPAYWEQPPARGVNNYALVQALSDAMTPGDVLIPGSSGACSEITMQAFQAKAGQRVLNSEGLGPMGFGIAAALGGCLASGGRRTVCLDGDGGFVMNVQELEVVRRLGLPIKFFVLNNGGYGSIRSSQNAYFGGHYVASEPGSGLTLPDLEKVARSYELPFLRIEFQADLRALVARALEGAGPLLCEVIIPVDQATAPRITSRQNAAGKMESAPLEELSPPLPREEFLANMLIPALP